jgi:probable F420-dependent oxidoreductase
VDFGVGYFPTHNGMSPGAVAQMVEERGQESLFFAEHTHIPASRASAWRGGAGLPQKYWHMYDLFVALTAAAVATTKLRVGSGICLVIERDPIITANEVASVDHLSGGRMVFGIGAGWNREEMQNHGTDPRKRMAVMRERVEAMKEIWTKDEASYSGEYVEFERIWSYPKPAQWPHPPILVGGEGPTVFDRVLGYAHGWLPRYRDDDELFRRIDELRAKADRPIEIDMMGVPANPKALERTEAAGCRRAIRWLPSGDRSTVERALEGWEAGIAKFVGEV